MPAKVLLTDTSWWPLASRAAIALSRLDCSVSAVYPANGHPLSKTGVIEERFRYHALDPVGSVEAAIEKVQPDLVIPCDDRAVRHLHQVHARAAKPEVRGIVERSLGAPLSYPIVTSRHELLEVAREEGILIPETGLVTDSKKLASILPNLKLPWVLKSDGSWGGHGVKIAPDPTRAEQLFLELSRPLSSVRYLKRLIVDRDPFWFEAWRSGTRPAVIIQSHIEGRPANSVMACWNGEVLAEIEVEVVNAQGATGPATIVKVVSNPQMRFAAERLACRLRLSGIYGLDFMIEEETGSRYLIEMNPRCTPLSHLALGQGRDLMAAISEQLTGISLDQSVPITQNDTIAYFPQAWHWDPKSELLHSIYHDVPWEEPALVQELSRIPYPERGVLARLLNLVRGKASEDLAEQRVVVDIALEAHSPVEARARNR